MRKKKVLVNGYIKSDGSVVNPHYRVVDTAGLDEAALRAKDTLGSPLGDLASEALESDEAYEHVETYSGDVLLEGATFGPKGTVNNRDGVYGGTMTLRGSHVDGRVSGSEGSVLEGSTVKGTLSLGPVTEVKNSQFLSGSNVGITDSTVDGLVVGSRGKVEMTGMSVEDVQVKGECDITRFGNLKGNRVALRNVKINSGAGTALDLNTGAALSSSEVLLRDGATLSVGDVHIDNAVLDVPLGTWAHVDPPEGKSRPYHAKDVRVVGVSKFCETTAITAHWNPVDGRDTVYLNLQKGAVHRFRYEPGGGYRWAGKATDPGQYRDLPDLEKDSAGREWLERLADHYGGTLRK